MHWQQRLNNLERSFVNSHSLTLFGAQIKAWSFIDTLTRLLLEKHQFMDKS
jgi:hypothetical protein